MLCLVYLKIIKSNKSSSKYFETVNNDFIKVKVRESSIIYKNRGYLYYVDLVSECSTNFYLLSFTCVMLLYDFCLDICYDALLYIENILIKTYYSL